MPSSTVPKYLIVVAGPTAVGKTALCIDLALRLGTEIVSADARQCYQGMAIGTAQPTAVELQAVPHHLVNFLPVETPYSAGRYMQDALNTLATLFTKYDCVLMTGGSGMYIQAVCEGLDAMPPIVPAIRADLNQQLQKEGLGTLVAKLATYDPAYYQIIDQANPQRVIRALEVCLATGQPYSSFRKQRPAIRPFNTIKIGLTRDRSELYQRINTRVEQILTQGLVDEAAALYPYRDYNALQTVGYRELFGWMDGHYDQAEAIRLLKRNTRRYAKRQLTWLGRDEGICWFHPDERDPMLSYLQRKINTL